MEIITSFNSDHLLHVHYKIMTNKYRLAIKLLLLLIFYLSYVTYMYIRHCSYLRRPVSLFTQRETSRARFMTTWSSA